MTLPMTEEKPPPVTGDLKELTEAVKVLASVMEDMKTLLMKLEGDTEYIRLFVEFQDDILRRISGLATARKNALKDKKETPQ